MPIKEQFSFVLGTLSPAPAVFSRKNFRKFVGASRRLPAGRLAFGLPAPYSTSAVTASRTLVSRRCRQRPSEYLAGLCVDTMGFWAPHVREAVEVFGVDRVMFGTDYGPVPIDPKVHVDIVNALEIPDADKQKIFWQNANSFFGLGLR